MIAKGFRIGIFIFSMAGANAVAQSWTERIQLSNDFRLRTEYLETTNSAAHPQLRQRLRARLGLQFEIDETLTSKVMIASGSQDPVSTNQSLDDGFTSKEFLLNEAYVRWAPRENLSVLLGKAKNVFYSVGKNEMIWDSDLRPEGMAVQYDLGLGAVDLEANGSFYWVDANADDDSQVLLGGLQLVGNTSFNEELSMTISAGIYDYSHLGGHAAIVDFNGNSNTGTNGVYTENFQLIEGSIGLTYQGLGTPTTVYYSLVNNAQADNEENGFIVGLVVGKTKEKGDVSFLYNYRKVEANAVLGAFTHSDFNNGNTNGKGHQVAVGYGLSEKASAALSFFASETSTTGNANDAYRGQLDLKFSF